MFPLSRNGNNIPAEVQRWQYFLRKLSIDQVGNIDADFGIKTETGTKIFQVMHGLPSTGKVNLATLEKAKTLGYTIVPGDYYSTRAGASFPPKPTDLTTPSNSLRNTVFTCFNFIQRPLSQRADKEAIVIRGNCTNTVPDWTAAHIIEVPIPQLRFAVGYNGKVRCHKLAAPVWIELFKQWEKDDLLHLILSYAGCFVPRYKREQAPPGAGGHGLRSSTEVEELSNHSFGSAFDINVTDNGFRSVPALCGRRGSTRELVASANRIGIYWGGHFRTQDGMHFEISQLPPL